jgi:hypothetical protein
MRKFMKELRRVPSQVLVGMVIGLALALWIVVKADA